MGYSAFPDRSFPNVNMIYPSMNIEIDILMANSLIGVAIEIDDETLSVEVSDVSLAVEIADNSISVEGTEQTIDVALEVA